MARVTQVYRLNEKKADAVASVIFGLVAWEIVDSFFIDNPLILVGPWRIAEAFMNLLARGEIARHVYTTFVEFILGYLVGTAIGIGLGFLMRLSRSAKDVLNPWVTISYNAPIILL